MYRKQLFGFFSAVILLTASCATNNKNEVSIVSLDRAIEIAAVEIGDDVGAGQKIALLNFNSPSVDFSEYVLDELESLLVKSKKFVVVDRRELDLIRQEVDYQRSGEVSDESAQSIGRQLGAQVIISGSLSNIGNIYRFRIRALNVESAAIEAAPSADIDANDEKTMLLLSVKQQAPVVEVVQEEESDIYKIGDTGPAGGIVFYDKGEFSDGWRYFEAAPASTQLATQWGALDYNIHGLENEVGSGRENTRIILEQLNQKRERDRAAQICQNLDFGGFNDWFLPSLKELDLMYNNLKLNGFGDFGNRWYWSSSAESGKGGHNSWCKSFANGNLFYIGRNQIQTARAIRAF